MSNQMPLSDQEMSIQLYKRKLTIRYMFALALIASVMCFSYFFLVHQIESNREDAHIINMSGKQRMLSQRIALLSREIYHAPTDIAADLYATKMNKALTLMEVNHKTLLGEGSEGQKNSLLSSKILDIYYGEKGINTRLDIYMVAARNFLTLYGEGGRAAVVKSNLMDEIVSIARNGLLDQLNLAVNQYQLEYERKVDAFKRYETMFFAFGLLLLLTEILIIFRPMVKEIIRNKESLETTNKELVEFSYRISHDLRAPIVSSIGLSQMAVKSLKNNEIDITSKTLDHISTSMKKLESLIDDVLNLTRMKMTESAHEEIDVKEVIEEAVFKLKDMPCAKDIEIQKDVKIKEPITTERLYLQQTIENLLSNAIKYYDSKKSNPYVLISAIRQGKSYLFSIRDNGIGVPEASQEKLFGMFQRFHPKVSFGSGLGLYLVQQNVKRIGGYIEYKPHEDGSEFIVTIPIEA